MPTAGRVGLRGGLYRHGEDGSSIAGSGGAARALLFRTSRDTAAHRSCRHFTRLRTPSGSFPITSYRADPVGRFLRGVSVKFTVSGQSRIK
jgi:hypothetical protein